VLLRRSSLRWPATGKIGCSLVYEQIEKGKPAGDNNAEEYPIDPRPPMIFTPHNWQCM
jgi:hypothetical protein